jgi:hypothetical protein
MTESTTTAGSLAALFSSGYLDVFARLVTMLGTSYQVTRLMKLTKLQQLVPTCLLTLSTLLQDDNNLSQTCP